MNPLFKLIDKPVKDGMPRNGFSMDHSRQFALNAGELHCPTQIDVVPGDHVKLQASAFFRAMTLNSAAFANCKVLVDWYFVPYVQLWSLFDNFLTQRDQDKFSSAFNSSLNQPYMALRQIIGGIFTLKNSPVLSSLTSDSFLFRSCDRALQLLDELGYGNYFPLFEWYKAEYIKYTDDQEYDERILDFSFIPDVKVAMWRILAYQKIWNAYYRDSEVDTPLPTHLYNVDFLNCENETKANYMYGISDDSDFRNMLFDNVVGNRGLLNMRYRKWTKDIFTSTQPSTQFGPVSTVPISVEVSGPTSNTNTGYEGEWTFSTLSDLANGDGYNIFFNNGNAFVTNENEVGSRKAVHRHPVSKNSLTSLGVSSFSVLLQKYAEAMQEWRQAALRAGNRMKDNMKAHYGVEPYYHNDTEPLHLQSWEFTMQPTDVTATANTGETGNNELGSTTGKLVGGSEFNRPVEFSAKDFGTIMCMVCVVPQSGYDSYMLDKLNTKGSSPFDYFTPEFDNIGLSPITVSELNFAASPTIMDAYDYSLGYHARFSEYKYMLSKSFHLFEHSHIEDVPNGEFSSYVTNRFDLQSVAQVDGTNPEFSRFFRYINPSVLSSIFVQQNASISSPQFICTFGFYGTKVSNMSVIGMPRF